VARLPWGTGNYRGRRLGVLNRFTRLREEFIDVHQNCGGRGGEAGGDAAGKPKGLLWTPGELDAQAESSGVT